MQQDNRHFIIISKHKRLTRLWQFFFTGWGLVMVAALVTASLLTEKILWTPIKIVDMNDIVTNQLQIKNAAFVGTDKDGNPFKVQAISGHQEYQNPDIIYLDKPSGVITRKTDKGKVTSKISSKTGQFNHKEKVLTLYGDVRLNSSDGNKILTNEMVIRL